MKKKSELYNVVVDTKNEGSFYVGYYSVGGGVYEFYFSRSPVMELFDINVAIHYRDLLIQTAGQGGCMAYKSDYVMIVDNFNYGIISEVKIQKQKITTTVEFEYID